MKEKNTSVISALLHEYAYALNDLKGHISDVTAEELTASADKETTNPDCVSIQSILTHIVLCGYNYVTMMDIHSGNQNSKWSKRVRRKSIEEYNADFDAMLSHTSAFLGRFSNSDMYKPDPKDKLITFWGQYYDFEQLLEHAIVHISRHRRQIVHFKKKLRKQTN